MSEENDSNEGEGIASLRKQYEALKKQNEELSNELGTFRSKERVASVSEILKAKGLDDGKAAKAAALYAKTSEDASEDAVGKWFEDYADLLGAQKQDDQNANNAQRVANASSQVSAASAQSGPQGLMGDPAEMLELIQKLPYEELHKLYPTQFPERPKR